MISSWQIVPTLLFLVLLRVIMSLNRKIGLIDGVVFLFFWSVTGMANATYWHGALPVIVFILVPLAGFVAWRGSVSVEKIINGKATNKSSAIEGAIYGLIVAIVLCLWSCASQVYAAGSVFDDLSPNSFEWYLRIFQSYLPFITAGAVIGSLHGVAFYNINKYLVDTIG